MAKIKIDIEYATYECPECGCEVEMGQNYCQDCGEPLEWVEELDLRKINFNKLN